MNEHRALTDEEAHRFLLDSEVNTLPHLTKSLRNIYKHLSIHNGWETLASYLGLSTKDVTMYASLIPANPSRLPAETFFIHYWQEFPCSLRDLLGALLEMGDPHCHVLAQNIMADAWNGYLSRQQAHPPPPPHPPSANPKPGQPHAEP